MWQLAYRNTSEMGNAEHKKQTEVAVLVRDMKQF